MLLPPSFFLDERLFSQQQQQQKYLPPPPLDRPTDRPTTTRILPISSKLPGSQRHSQH